MGSPVDQPTMIPSPFPLLPPPSSLIPRPLAWILSRAERSLADMARSAVLPVPCLRHFCKHHTKAQSFLVVFQLGPCPFLWVPCPKRPSGARERDLLPLDRFSLRLLLPSPNVLRPKQPRCSLRLLLPSPLSLRPPLLLPSPLAASSLSVPPT